MGYLNVHYSGFIILGIYVLTRSVLAFYNIWTLKMKIKHRYNYTYSALMG